MKKILLFLFFPVLLFSQVPDIESCSTDQTATVDLTVNDSAVLGGQDPQLYTVSYFNSEIDAFNYVNEIQNPQHFTVNASSTFVFARITNLEDDSFDILGFQVIIHPAPEVSHATLVHCTGEIELPFYYLDEAVSQILGNNPDNYSISFHEFENEAVNNQNPILDMAIPGNPQGMIFARVENVETGCYSIVYVFLTTCVISCNAPENIEVVEMADTIAQINWNNNASMGIIYSKISIRPYGEPIDENNIIISQYYQTYVFTGLTIGECYSVNVKTVCDVGTESEWSETYDFCVLGCENIGYCPESLTMIAFYDENNNGIKDEDELFFNQGHFVYQINDSGNDLYGYSWNNGTFILYENNENNSYDIQYVINPQYASVYSCTTTYSNISLPNNSGNTTLYFPITADPFTDASVSIYGSPPRPGFTYTNTIFIKNEGTQIINDYSLNFIKDPNVSIVSISETGAVTNPDGFQIDFGGLLPFETKYVFVTMQVPVIPTVNLGDILTNNATLSASGDENEQNNAFAISQVVVGSYDPNDKLEIHGGKIALDTFTEDDYLYYTVRFENTGTANAEFVRITDTLSEDLDESTFEMLEASHTVNTRREGNLITWIFPFIDLPPTSVNEEESQGFVFFRVKPESGYALGDIITNTAEIYFDYNPAIVTNTVETEFVETLSITSYKQTNIIIAPNPASVQTIVYAQNTETIKNVTVYDISGKKILNVQNTGNYQIMIDTGKLVSGLYLIEIEYSDDKRITKKLQVR